MQAIRHGVKLLSDGFGDIFIFDNWRICWENLHGIKAASTLDCTGKNEWNEIGFREYFQVESIGELGEWRWIE